MLYVSPEFNGMEVEVKHDISSKELIKGSKARAMIEKEDADDAANMPKGPNIKKQDHKTIIKVTTKPKSQSRSLSMKDKVKEQEEEEIEAIKDALKPLHGR